MHIYTHTHVLGMIFTKVKYNHFSLILSKQKSLLMVLAGLDPSSSADWAGAAQHTDGLFWPLPSGSDVNAQPAS